MVGKSLLAKIAGKGGRSSPTSHNTTLDNALFKLCIGRKSKGKQNSTPRLKKHKCKSSKCAAMTVLFELPELLEIVLKFLDTEEVLTLRRVSQHWNDTILESPTLRLHHFVFPNWSLNPANFQLLHPKVHGLSITPGEKVDRGQWVEITMTYAAARNICVWDPWMRRRPVLRGTSGGLLGGRAHYDSDTSWPARSTSPHGIQRILSELDVLQVMRPPILGLQAFVIRSGTDPAKCSSEPRNDKEPSFFNDDPDEHNENDGTAPYAKLHCDAGITLGFLADTCQLLLMDGYFDPDFDEKKIVFKGIVSFTPPAKARRKRDEAHSLIRLVERQDDE